jgi:hypothetical protein
MPTSDRAITVFNKVLNPMRPYTNALYDLVGLFLPRLCAGCDTALMRNEGAICLGCESELPLTRFHDDEHNAVEQVFKGRVRLDAASALLRFTRDGMVQHMLHRLKYKGDRCGLGLVVAWPTGVVPFRGVDVAIAVPLHAAKLRQHGFNQAQVRCANCGPEGSGRGAPHREYPYADEEGRWNVSQCEVSVPFGTSRNAPRCTCSC